MEKCSSVIYSAFHQDYASGHILHNIKSRHHLYPELRLIPKKYVFHGHEGDTLMMLSRSKHTRWCSCSEMLCWEQTTQCDPVQLLLHRWNQVKTTMMDHLEEVNVNIHLFINLFVLGTYLLQLLFQVWGWSSEQKIVLKSLGEGVIKITGNSWFYGHLQYSRISAAIGLSPGCSRNTQEAVWKYMGWLEGDFLAEVGVKLVLE